MLSNLRDIPPINSPSNRAYIGALTGAREFLKIVATPTISPPIPPTKHNP